MANSRVLTPEEVGKDEPTYAGGDVESLSSAGGTLFEPYLDRRRAAPISTAQSMVFLHAYQFPASGLWKTTNMDSFLFPISSSSIFSVTYLQIETLDHFCL